MADIFVSYARSDRDRVMPLVEVLEAQGWSVWWDRELIPGSAYEQAIDDAISEARVVIVAWSEESVRSEWVQAEAGDGLDRHILVPIMIDDVRVPISFRRKHAARLIDWPIKRDEEEIRNLIRGIEDCLQGRSTSLSEPRGESLNAPTKGSRLIRPTLVLLTAVLAAFGIYHFSGSTLPTAPSVPGADAQVIAVLPFTTASDLVAEEYLQLGFEITQGLSKLSDLRVVPGELVASIPASSDPVVVGRRVSAQFLLSGSILNDEAAPSLELRLYSTLNGRMLTAKQMHLSEGVSDVSGRVVSMVVEALGLKPATSSGYAGVISSDAYMSYLSGKAELRRSANGVKNLAGAVALFEDAIAQEPRFGLAHSGLCELYIADYRTSSNVESFDYAEKHCNRALTLNPEDVEVLAALGQLYRVSGLLNQALSSYERAASIKPFDTAVMRGMAEVYADMGMAVRAEEMFRTVIQLEPTYWLNHRLLGILYYTAGRYSEAANEFQIESQLSPEKAGSMLNLGSALLLAGDFDAAIDVWQISVADSGEAGAYSNLGSAKFFAGDFIGAAEMYERSIALQPSVHEYWGNAAEAYYFAGSDEHQKYFRQALDLVDENLKVNPEDYHLLSARAVYRASLDQEGAAQSALRQALAGGADDPITWYDAARVYTRLNQDTQALESLRRALDMGYPPALAAADANFSDFVSDL